MKKLLILLGASCMCACSGSNADFKEPAYMGYNGQISTIEVEHYSGNQGDNSALGTFWGVEVFTFDNDGNLKERRRYSDQSKKVLLERDTYKRDKNGLLVEEYKGFNLNDNHYAGESLWQRIEDNEGTERWQLMGEDWWGTAYQDITYNDGKRHIKYYVIKKDDGEEVSVTHTTQTVNDRGQLIVQKTVKPNYPENTNTWTYNEHGHLLKVELEQVHDDGTVNKMVDASYTIDEVDDNNNPLLTTDDRGEKRVYKYTYR